ncbi:MAG: UDP-3-O-(3-hydroxymyristoyl)glucosamine N-acyltransferase [Candidatus Eremiobacteraeota bacterium]|nr:UDP-3-O-(3-hydroxymyristoyl)glucosamine N-acyltransferase [Candidatus Eremiobacteraeota bacterium]
MTLEEYADRVGGHVRGDASIRIDGIASVEDARTTSLTFATDERYLRTALASRAAAVLTEPALADRIGSARKPLLLVPSCRAALATLLAMLEPPRPAGPFRDPSAVVDPSATIGPDVYVGALAYVGPHAEIGANCVLLAGAHVGAHARLGRDSTLHPRALLLDRCVAGERVTLQAGAVIGSDGFGYVFADGRFSKIPQIGDVVLGDDVEIGANTCVDRAQTGTTSIGTGTKIDNLVQIGHNCRIGKHSGFAAMTGLAGSTDIGDYTVVGGQSAFKGHITVGSRVRIAGNTMVWGDVPDGAFISGQPARDHREELKQQVRLRNLEKLFERVSALEQK